MDTKYNPTDIEAKWYKYWLDNKLFHSEPDGRDPFTVVIPPPNVTGVLHMGHVLNETIQDILVRRATPPSLRRPKSSSVSQNKVFAKVTSRARSS